MKKLILILLATGSSFGAAAQIPQPDPDTTAKHFLIVSSIGNLNEVSAGQLAIQNAKHENVKVFGEMMIKDHGDIERELLQLAREQQINLPAAATGGVLPDPALKNAGQNFDKLYVHAMVSAHQNTVETFENYAINGKNPAVKAFARQMLPQLKAHLNQIKAIDLQLNKNSR